MKILVDGKQVLELTETQKQVIKNDIPTEIFQEDMERRVGWILTHKYERCFERLKNEWDKKLLKPIIDPATKAETPRGVSSIPLDKDAYATLVFSQPDYKNRSARELEAKQVENP